MDAKTYRDVVDVWLHLCDCNGPQPSPGDLKLSLHDPRCEFAQWCDHNLEPERKEIET